ncbi:MAG: epsE 4 [Planctomycetaceae bacterium]|nr:epsE 4 [Planctomycetaceae bacterium]
MVFGWGKRAEAEEEDDDDDDEEMDLVLFQGALNGVQPNMKENARLVSAGLMLAKELVTNGLSRRAGSIRVDPKGERSQVTFIIDGVAFPGDRISKQEGLAITQVMKLLAGLDIKERKVPQQGGLKAEFEEKPYELQVISQAAEGGERLTVRCTDTKVKLDTPNDLGFTDEFKQKIRALASIPGVFLVVGPAGSGVTTLKFVVVRGVDCFTHQIFTIGESGRKLDNVTAFKANEGDSLEQTLGRIYRIDGDIVITPDVRDAETAKMLFNPDEDDGYKAALIAEMPGKDPPAAVVQLLEWIGDPVAVSKGLNGLIMQKLIRTLCSKCKQAYRPNPQFLKKVGLPEDLKVLYRKPKVEEDEPEPDSCEKCGDLGYYGQVPMFELLEMTDEMRALIATKPDVSAIRTQAKKEKMLTVQQDALRLVAEGKTSLEEVQRVFKAT